MNDFHKHVVVWLMLTLICPAQTVSVDCIQPLSTHATFMVANGYWACATRESIVALQGSCPSGTYSSGVYAEIVHCYTVEQIVQQDSIALEGGPDPEWMAGWKPTPLPAANPGICLNSRWRRFWGGQRWRLCRKGERR